MIASLIFFNISFALWAWLHISRLTLVPLFECGFRLYNGVLARSDEYLRFLSAFGRVMTFISAREAYLQLTLAAHNPWRIIYGRAADRGTALRHGTPPYIRIGPESGQYNKLFVFL